MVQREVADRFFAVPSTKAYGAVSVLVQLATERTGFHPVSRTVFRPPPNVDSALVAFRAVPLPRASPNPPGRRGSVRPPSQDARELAPARRRRDAGRGRGGARRARARSRRACRGARAARFVGLTRQLGETRPAPAKINLALVVGPLGTTASTRSPPSCSASSSRDRVAVRPAARLDVAGFADDTIVAAALVRSRAADGSSRAGACEITKTIPVAGGPRRRQLRRRSRAPARERAADHPLEGERLDALAATIGADVPFFLHDGPAARDAATAASSRRSTSRRTTGRARAARGSVKESTAAVYRAFDARRRREASASAERHSWRRSPTSAAARPRRLPAERSRCIAARRRADGARRVPRRRQRRRSDASTASSSHGPRPRPPPRECEPPVPPGSRLRAESAGAAGHRRPRLP